MLRDQVPRSDAFRVSTSRRSIAAGGGTITTAGTGASRYRGRAARRPPNRTFCSPLESVHALLSWRPTAAAARCVSRVALPDAAVARFVRTSSSAAPRTTASPLGTTNSVTSKMSATSASTTKRIQPPRLLMCHEFGDGYLPAEAAADGVTGADCPSDEELWRFNHWAYVDVFVYASKYRVSIPPVGYIHAGHRHGALVLGCLRFESNDENALNELAHLMGTYNTRAKACTQLASIAKFFGFDGWLVRIEALPEGCTSSDIAGFVADINRACRKALGPACEVVWFDSMTRKGVQRPQNELNEENVAFFKAAGAMFTGFHWTRNAPVRSAVKAGPRRTDVFTGIDVHGRRTFGGGGFQTHIALRAIKQAGTSAAIFAPSWTVENCPPDMNPAEMEERFWTGPRGRFARECVAQYFKERAVLTQLPFATFFDPGWGPRTVSSGNVVSEERYFSMKRQDVQPSFLRTKTASGDGAAATLALSHEHALNGSASIRLTFSFSESRMLSGTYTLLRLFIANVTFPKQHPGTLRISYQYMVDNQNSMKSLSMNRSRRYGAAGDLEEEDEIDSTAQAAREAGANQFGLLLLFAAPMRAVMLVSENSRWHAGPEEGIQRAAPRLEILEKYVEYVALPPVHQCPVRGSPRRPDGDHTWMSRTFEIPPQLLQGQRLQEVMVIVGEPPLQPISVRPSPLVTPRSHSRVASFRGTRPGSGLQSPMEQQQILTTARANSFRGSATTRASILGADFQSAMEQQHLMPSSRSNSFRSSMNPRTKLGAELFNAGLFGNGENYENSLRRMSRSESLPRNDPMNGMHKFGSRNASALTEDTDNNSECGSDASDKSSQKSFRSYNSRASRQPRRYPAKDSRITRMDDLNYESNFDVGGTVDFSRMKADVLNQSASRAISRLGSRLGTPDSARYSRVSRYSSRAGSRIPSRNPSRVTSPSATPLGGGGGALPVRTYSARGSIGLSSSGASALADLKASLMSAADTMAVGVADFNNDNNPRAARRSTQPRGTQRVFLGGLALEIVDG